MKLQDGDKVIPRKVPKIARSHRILFKDNDDFGMINLCCWTEEINRLRNTKEIVIKSKSSLSYF